MNVTIIVEFCSISKSYIRRKRDVIDIFTQGKEPQATKANIYQLCSKFSVYN